MSRPRADRKPPSPTARATRERILAASLALFNAEGEPNIGTNDIADETGISPGNLYYHFRNKAGIVEELYARFEAEIDEILPLPAQRMPDFEDLWLLLHLAFERMVRYRFLYRDPVDIMARHDRVRRRFVRLLARAHASASGLLDSLRKGGSLAATVEEAEELIDQMLLTMTFWQGWRAVHPPPTQSAADIPASGIVRIMQLLAPRLDAPSRIHLETLIRRYTV